MDIDNLKIGNVFPTKESEEEIPDVEADNIFTKTFSSLLMTKSQTLCKL